MLSRDLLRISIFANNSFSHCKQKRAVTFSGSCTSSGLLELRKLFLAKFHIVEITVQLQIETLESIPVC